MDENLKRLLAELKPAKFYTAKQLSSKLSISEKTVRQRIKELNLILSEHGAEVLSSSGQGFLLSVTGEEEFSAWRKQLQRESESLPTTVWGRVSYIVERLLYAEDYLKLDDLCQELYISRTTITTDMKQAKDILDRHHLAVVQRPGSGIILEGSEYYRRSCMVYELLQKDYSGGSAAIHTEDTYPILALLSQTFKACGLKTAEWTLKNLIFYICVTLRRIKAGHSISLSEQVKSEVQKTSGENVSQAAKMIADQLEQYAGCRLDENERAMLMIHLGGKSDSSTILPSKVQTQVDDYMERLAGKMLEAVYETHGLDLRADQEAIASLKQHLIPFDMRMKYDMPQSNPILGEIKEEYSLAYAIASTASAALARHYGKPIPEEEIGFFAILFALAIQKQEQQRPKKNIVVICVSGQASSRLFIYRCRQAFAPYIDQIYECSAFSVTEFDFIGKNIDCVFTTVPLSVSLPVPVIQVSPLLSEEEVGRCQKLLSGEGEDFVSRYFRKELFLGPLHGESKEEVLSQMCQKVAERFSLPEDFYEAVCRREELGQTDFGNLVAIPHPCRIMGTEKFVSVAILDKPIWWGHNDVQVVLLISLAQEDNEIERFFALVSDFLASPSMVQTLIKRPTYSCLMDLFCHNQ